MSVQCTWNQFLGSGGDHDNFSRPIIAERLARVNLWQVRVEGDSANHRESKAWEINARFPVGMVFIDVLATAG